MSNTIFITANWTTGALSQQTISRQYDNNRYAVQFIGYPEGDGTEELDLYLLVWMSTAPGQRPGEITPIQLNSDQWYISNYFTQQVQVIKFQLCVLNEAGTYEAHSPIFSGRIGDSLEHNGTSQDIDVSTLFDAYREYVEELIIAAGAAIIDPAPTQGSSNAVSSGGVYEALADVSLRPSIPVRQAIFALLESAGYATTTGVSDNLAIVEAWVNATTAITLSQTSLTLASRGATSQLTATTVPSGNTVLWESSDESVATVDSTGLVTAVSVGTATISAVSGDIRARCTVTVSWEIPDTTAQIAQENMKFYDNGNNHEIRAKENAGITIVYEMDTPSTVLYPAGVIVGDGLTSNNATDSCTMRIYKDGEFVNYWGIYDRWLKAPASSYTEYKRSTNVSEYNEIAFTLDMRYLDDSYMYDYTTGQIWFAGVNTPYYGMSNVSEAV